MFLLPLTCIWFLFTPSNFSAKKLTEEELNALIAHAHRRIEQLQRTLAEQVAMEAKRIQDALEQQKKEEDLLTTKLVMIENERLKDTFAMEKQNWVSSLE